MNKTNIYGVITLAIVGLFLLPTFSSASTTSNVSIQSSGRVLSASSPINKYLVAYGFSWDSSSISFVANHYGLLDTSFGMQLVMESMKAINPNIKIIGYKCLIGMTPSHDDWTIVNSHEDWFVHDANGNRLQGNSGFGPYAYLMDVNSAGWRQHWVTYVNSKLTNAYDGVFADNCWNSIGVDWALAHFSSDVPSSVIAAWHSGMTGFLQYIKANLTSGKILVVNSDECNTDDYLQIADGQMLEGFGHAPWLTVDQVNYNLMLDVQALARKSNTGKIVLAHSGTLTTGASQAQIDRWLTYCYASFLLGLNGPEASWGWYQSSTGILNAFTYVSIMDTNVGSPIGAYYSNQNVYMRDFTGVKVLLNPSADSYTINLGGTYTRLDGTPVANTVLAPYTGEILLFPT